MLSEEVKIKQILDSESNKETEDDKHNRVDILVENSKEKATIHEIYPEYWVIKVGKFHNRVKDKLDEWIYFFKNAEIKSGSTAKGLKEVSERLDEMKLKEKDAKDYKRYLKQLRDVASEQHTKMADARDLIKKGEGNKEIEAVIGFYENDVPIAVIAKSLKITKEQVLQIIENHTNK